MEQGNQFDFHSTGNWEKYWFSALLLLSVQT
jgi:hypothetical protein